MKITRSKHTALFIAAMVILVAGRPALEALGVGELLSYIPFFLVFILLIIILILDRRVKPAPPGSEGAPATEPEDSGMSSKKGLSLPAALLQMSWMSRIRLIVLGAVAAAIGYALIDGLERLDVSREVTTLGICALLLIQFQLGGRSKPEDPDPESSPEEEPEEPGE